MAPAGLSTNFWFFLPTVVRRVLANSCPVLRIGGERYLFTLMAFHRTVREFLVSFRKAANILLQSSLTKTLLVAQYRDSQQRESP